MNEIIDWINTNSGFVSVLIFLITLFLGWASGIFQALRRKPKFNIEVIPGPTMCSTYHTGKKFEGYDTHRTAISIYLKVINVGNAPSTIDKVEIAYHWNIHKINFLWLRYRIGWFWLKKTTVCIEDFRVPIGEENIKVFPFLFQKSILIDSATDTYLEIGKNATGMVYFEQDESWGGSSPFIDKGTIQVKVRVYDSFNNSYSVVSSIPVVDIDEAKKYNPYFGETLAMIDNQNVRPTKESNNEL